jgi:hypothetical protein
VTTMRDRTDVSTHKQVLRRDLIDIRLAEISPIKSIQQRLATCVAQVNSDVIALKALRYTIYQILRQNKPQ